MHDGATRILSTAMIVLGVLLIARAGSLLGVIVGIAMVAAGVGRLWVVAQQRPRR